MEMTATQKGHEMADHPTFQELRDGQQYRLTRTGETVTISGQQYPGQPIHIKRADGTYEYTTTRQIERI